MSEESLSKARCILSKVEVVDNRVADLGNASSRVSIEEFQASSSVGLGMGGSGMDAASMGGFSTARGKPVAVSEKALAKARGLLATSDKEANVKETSGYHAGQSEPPSSMGFSTGRGQPVVVSEEALARARGVLASSGSGSISGEVGQPSADFKGFSTGRGELVAVSKEALAKARALVAPSGAVQKESHMENFVPGFSTARGQKVVVSDQALSRARKVLADGDGSKTADSEIKTPLGFSTGRGAPVTVSKAALAKVKSMLEEQRPQEEGQLPPAMSGFSTGRGQPVKISVAALARAKTLVPSEKPHDEHLEDKEDSVDWGEEDDNDMVNLATMAEEVDQFNFQPYRCKPYDFKPSPFAYRGGPEMIQEQTTPTTNFNTPYSGAGKGQKREMEDYESVLVKRKKESNETLPESKEEGEVLSLAERRARCRRRQELLIASKRNKNVRAMPGRLFQKRSSNPRLPSPQLLDKSRSHSTLFDKVTSSNALHWRFKGCEHFSKEAVEEADQVHCTEQKFEGCQNSMETIRLPWEMAFGLYSTTLAILGWQR